MGSYLFEEETDARLSQENFQVLRPGGKAQGTNFVQDEKLLKHFKQQRGKISWRRFSPIELNMKEASLDTVQRMYAYFPGYKAYKR